MDQGILVVDETRNGTGTHMLMPTDASVDSFYNYLLAGYSYHEFDVYAENRAPNVLDFEHYSTIIWHHDVTYQTKIDDSEPALKAFLNLVKDSHHKEKSKTQLFPFRNWMTKNRMKSL